LEAVNIFEGSPYLWGGKTPFGIDCSGFTQMIYKMNNIFLPRDAGKQVELGRTLNFLNEAKPGDLAFFDNDEGLITHVGVLLGSNKIIHASGMVRKDIIDHQGIFNVDIKRYTHKLRVIKSIA
jgi:gamma-D-glutamyl-L-lysine dipeptidyl-peptidase